MTFDRNKHEQEDFSKVEAQDQFSNSKILEQKVIPLLEERLMVDIARRKTGEIVVRKEIKTHIITLNIPVRSEKIIVEQVSPEYKKITEISLGEFNLFNQSTKEKDNSEILRSIFSQEPLDLNSTPGKIVKGDFNSLEDAHIFLDLVFSQASEIEGSIRVEVILNN